VYDLARQIATEQGIPINTAILNTALCLHAREQCHAWDCFIALWLRFCCIHTWNAWEINYLITNFSLET